MAEADSENGSGGTVKVLQDAGSPLGDSTVLRRKRVILVRDLDVETILPVLKPYLDYSRFDAISAETNRGSKTGKLIDTIQMLSVGKCEILSIFLRTIGGTQPGLFSELVGRGPSQEEADFCVEEYVQNLRSCIKAKGHCTDSILDEVMDLDSEHIQLAIVSDRQISDTFEDLPYRYQTHLSQVQNRKVNISSVEALGSAHDDPTAKRVALSGRAGSGKTTTFQWLAREWSFRRWGPQFTLLFLLQLRMLSVSDHHITAIELLTLAGLYQVVEVGLVVPLSSWLKHAAERVIIMIDGLDEVAGFARRLRNCPIISDLSQKAHPIHLCLNILRGNLLPGVTVISASRSFAGLDALQFDKKFEILGLTESRVREFVDRKHTLKALTIMAVLKSSPLLMSVCSITFYCALICRLLSDGVIFPQEELQTYTRLMAFLIVQCVERKMTEWSFSIHVSSYFSKLAHLAYKGVFERQLEGKMSKLVFDDRDIGQVGLNSQDLKLIQEAGLMYFQRMKVGLRSSVIAEFFHFSFQEMLASAYFLPQLSLSPNTLKKLFSGGQFNMALLYLFGLQYDDGSEWVKDIRCSVDPSNQSPYLSARQQMGDFINGLCKQSFKQRDFRSKLHACQLLHEGQMKETAKSVVRYIVPDGKLTISNTLMTQIDLTAVCFVSQFAKAITEISLGCVGFTETMFRFMTSSLLKGSAKRLVVLDLEGNNLGSIGAKAVAAWVEKNHSVHALILYGNNMGDEGVMDLAAALCTNTSLRILDVGSNHIGVPGAAALADALHTNTSLQTLNVHHNNIDSDGITALAAALKTNNALHTLNISANNIGISGATVLASVLHTSKGLHTLDVVGNNIGDTGATTVARALHTNTSLCTLNVAYNNISNSGAKDLASALYNNTSLQTMDLVGNRIGSKGAAHVAEALHTNITLHTLNVRNNDIGDTGAAALAAALQTNTSLHTLDIGWNNIGDDGAMEIAAALVNNSTLHTVNIEHNHIGNSGIKALIGARHQGLHIES